MPELLTAKGLHDLVAPLWKAVPEAVPVLRAGDSSLMMMWDPSDHMFYWQGVGFCCRQVAEMVITHAIEEWALKAASNLRCFSPIDGTWQVTADSGVFVAEGPSRLHALVELALSISDAQDDEAEPCCPVGDPSCVSGDDECHDACEAPSVGVAGFRALADAEEEAGAIAAGNSPESPDGSPDDSIAALADRVCELLDAATRDGSLLYGDRLPSQLSEALDEWRDAQ